MTLAELQSLLKRQGVDFNTVVNPVGPTNEWTVAEQEEDCCQEVPDADPCVGDGKKVEPWNGWTDELKQELGFTPQGESAQEIFNRFEKAYGKGNVHLVVRKVGPTPCGEKVTNFVGTLGCCTNPSELIKYQGPSVVDVDEEFTFSVLSGTGEPTITWHTIGSGITVVKKSETEADANSDQCFCDPVIVYAQDSCESVAPWIVSRTGGSWSTIDDESLSSPFGWFQDGTSGYFYMLGFNDDNTKVSTQHYWQAEYVGTKEVVCQTSMPGINEDPIVEPQESQGFEKCEGSNIWVRLKEGFTNVYTVRYAIDNQGTTEYTPPGTCEAELIYDHENSVRVIGVNSSGTVQWEGGTPPFSVVYGGAEVFADQAKTTNEVYGVLRQYAAVYTGNACDYISVVVTDACGNSVYGYIYPTPGAWIEVTSSSYYTWFDYGKCDSDYWNSIGIWNRNSGFIPPRLSGTVQFTWGDLSVSSIGEPEGQVYIYSQSGCALYAGGEDSPPIGYTPVTPFVDKWGEWLDTRQMQLMLLEGLYSEAGCAYGGPSGEPCKYLYMNASGYNLYKFRCT